MAQRTPKTLPRVMDRTNGELRRLQGSTPFPFYCTFPSHRVSSLHALRAARALLQQGAPQTEQKQALLMVPVSFAPCHRREFFPVSTQAADGGKYKKSTAVSNEKTISKSSLCQQGPEAAS